MARKGVRRDGLDKIRPARFAINRD